MTYEVQCRVYGRNGNWRTVHKSDIKDAAETYAYLADRQHKTKEYRVVEVLPVEQTKQGPQLVIPGAERSAQQAMQGREAEGHGRIRARKPQQDPGGMFAPREPDQPGFDWEG